MAIDFACKTFDLKELIKCSLGLTRFEVTLFSFFTKHVRQEFTTEELSKELKVTLSAVQKGVKKIHEKDILLRKQRNREGGGYEFVYSLPSKNKAKEVLLKVINSWTEKIEKNIEKHSFDF